MSRHSTEALLGALDGIADSAGDPLSADASAFLREAKERLHSLYYDARPDHAPNRSDRIEREMLRGIIALWAVHTGDCARADDSEKRCTCGLDPSLAQVGIER